MEIVKDIKREIFKDYDIRGKYPEEINKDIAYTIGKSYGSMLVSQNKDKCVVAYDNRYSSLELSLALTLGILSTGVNVVSLGLATTPMAIYAKEILKCPSYIMVTASHTSKDENGFKFSFGEQGNVRGSEIQDFYEFTKNCNFVNGIGRFSKYDIKNDYLSLYRNDIKLGNKKLKVVLDLANATTTCIARHVFEMFDLDLTIIHEENDSSFPNHHPDPSISENLMQLKNEVLKLNADIGISFDCDGDNIGIIDDKGNIVKPDIYMAIMCKDIILNNDDKRILYDVKCSSALKNEIVKWGGIPVCYRTGVSYTFSKVVDDKIPFGGEYSGHIYFNDRITATGSAIYAALRLIELLSKSEEKLSEYVARIDKYYSTDEIKIDSSNKIKHKVMDEIKKYCRKMRFNIDDTDGVKIIKDDSWALIRVSNTGPYITARFESYNEDKLVSIQREFINLIKYFNK